MDVPPFMYSLDFDAMHVPKFSEYANRGIADPKDREFRIGMKYSSRKSVVTTIRSYTLFLEESTAVTPKTWCEDLRRFRVSQ
ncbi:hypothetical protein AHAS_Ahas06G0002000 [Arachis hypogaea]